MKVEHISYNNADIRFSKYGTLYLRLRPGLWIALCGGPTQGKLMRKAHLKGHRFIWEKIEPHVSKPCRRCGGREPSTRHWSSVYGFCDWCHCEFVKILGTAQMRFINDYKDRRRNRRGGGRRSEVRVYRAGTGRTVRVWTP